MSGKAEGKPDVGRQRGRAALQDRIEHCGSHADRPRDGVMLMAFVIRSVGYRDVQYDRLAQLGR